MEFFKTDKGIDKTLEFVFFIVVCICGHFISTYHKEQTSEETGFYFNVQPKVVEKGKIVEKYQEGKYRSFVIYNGEKYIDLHEIDLQDYYNSNIGDEFEAITDEYRQSFRIGAFMLIVVTIAFAYLSSGIITLSISLIITTSISYAGLMTLTLDAPFILNAILYPIAWVSRVQKLRISNALAAEVPDKFFTCFLFIKNKSRLHVKLFGTVYTVSGRIYTDSRSATVAALRG